MKDKSAEILQYMYRHMIENYVRSFNVQELPNTSGISYLANKGYVTFKQFGSTNASISMTTKGIDWVNENPGSTNLVPITNVNQASIQNGDAILSINNEIYAHVESLLESEHYFSAVEEAYKYVRKKLIEITGKEKASDVFNMNAENSKYHQVIFGKTADIGSPESDFYRGVGYLHLAIQFLRNEKTHTLATTLDKNLAIHYIALASLAYDLISKESKK